MTANKDIVHMDSAKKRQALPDFARFRQGGGGTEAGFGLARGGFGIYAYCPVRGIIKSTSEAPD
jgi:hypothetical protein